MGLRFGHAVAAICAVAVLAGCGNRRDRPTVNDTPEPGLRFVGEFGRGRDQCQILGDTPFARELSRPGRVLVACPAGAPAGSALLQAGAEQVGRTRNFSIFAVALAVEGAA